ncbi:MAG: ATP-binding protein [Candidatus Krumholzibacteria bacterium]|jgi:serine/threonine-protein kinase RsbW|nr:ATP-binding protein [Candidatus Krumholzibacteria bacterium]MDP6669815.1 ATP-binding protein [Candidatus Krumholzibacteria bacterium]MDP6796478.1 ATP-binding protein [Candidatus Krumholzibacteria bacterium]MDP7021608.1 ATP-binding protein [Candidatus Krumholzibacteria bacterium]
MKSSQRENHSSELASGGPRFRIDPELTGKVRFSLEFCIPSELRMVGPVVGYFSRLARGHAFKSAVWAEAMPLAVDEALSNAIRHGNAEDPAREVHISAEMDAGGLEIVVEDQGPGFDPEALPDPSSEEGKLRANGRGVFLMKELCDRVIYEEDGRRVRLYFKRN